ncbi:hypothetical protein F4677DRAFT_437482 [Hypoxylon crocopeplum]|nr:hypothetical protein F4677DRAFT_437482 [Hypoxylon crocopeplum]
MAQSIHSAATSAAGSPPSLSMDPEERFMSLQVSLAELTAKATVLYKQKKYDESAEVFAHATEMQAEMNGEMAPENADLLFLYGRCTLKLAVQKAAVLVQKLHDKRSNGAADKKPKAKKSQEDLSMTSGEEEELPDAKKLFQFTGDEQSEDTEQEDEAEDDALEEEDDFPLAFEVLDLARVLYEKCLERDGKKGALHTHVIERLGDTHDLLAEISLENEDYHTAIHDARQALVYKEVAYPPESEIRAEAHFKLALALEFSNMAEGGVEEMRKSAAEQMEKAIATTKLKLDAKAAELATVGTPHTPEDVEVTDIIQKQMAEVQEIIDDMEERLVDLQRPVVNHLLDAEDAVRDILGMALDKSPEKAAARLEEATKSAKDVSGLVRKKVKKEPEPESETNGKRKAEEPALGEDEVKRTKVEEPNQS